MTAPTTRETADHAELAADLLRVEYKESEWPLVLFCGRLVHIDNVLKYAADGLTDQLSEIAALRGAKWDVQHADTMNDMVLMGMARDEAIVRATQAERQRDELRKALETIGEMAPSTCETSLAHDMAQFANQALANQGADQ